MRETRPTGLTREEGFGLAVAVAAHGALIVALTLSPLGRPVQPPPQRMTVSFAQTIADQSTSPKPDAQAAPDVAPDLGEAAQADQPEAMAVPVPVPKPALKPEPKPKPAPAVKPRAEPKPTPEPKPVPRPKAEPKAKPDTKPDTKPKAEAKPAGGKAHPRANPAKPVGRSKIDTDFLNGIAGVTSPGTDKVAPADKPAAIASSTLVGVIARQIKPHWSAPQGVDADKLVTVLAWSLNPDGSLAGRPVMVSQSGVVDSNRAQAQRHVEMAIRAVELAAPFPLPSQAYAQWRRVAAFRFDRKLSQ